VELHVDCDVTACVVPLERVAVAVRAQLAGAEQLAPFCAQPQPVTARLVTEGGIGVGVGVGVGVVGVSLPQALRQAATIIAPATYRVRIEALSASVFLEFDQDLIDDEFESRHCAGQFDRQFL